MQYCLLKKFLLLRYLLKNIKKTWLNASTINSELTTERRDILKDLWLRNIGNLNLIGLK